LPLIEDPGRQMGCADGGVQPGRAPLSVSRRLVAMG
jgi:hypothetical protein